MEEDKVVPRREDVDVGLIGVHLEQNLWQTDHQRLKPVEKKLNRLT